MSRSPPVTQSFFTDVLLRSSDSMTTKPYTPIKRWAIPNSRLGQRRQNVIPKESCAELSLHQGDFVEVMRGTGMVRIKPEKLVKSNKALTSTHRATIDTRLAEGFENIKAGRVYE